MADSRTIRDELVKAVDMANVVQVRLYYAVAIFIKALKDQWSLPPCPTQNQTTTGKTSMTSLWNAGIPWRPEDSSFTDSTFNLIAGDPSFMASLARQLYNGDRQQTSKGKAPPGHLDSATAAMVAYGFFVEQTGFTPVRSMADIPFGAMANMISKPVYVAVKNHYTKTQVS
jgi:hypothetical protein